MTLVGYWPLSETTGATAYDYAGGHDGDINGTRLGQPGLLGETALEFDGVDDDVHVAHNDDFVMSEYTFSVWYNQYALVNEFDRVWDKGYSNNGSAMLMADSGTPKFYTVSNSGTTQSVSGSGSLNEWIHVVCAYNGQSQILYQDGEEIARASRTEDYSLTTTDTLAIGSKGAARHFNGRIAELRVYDRALSESEIRYLYSVSQRGHGAVGPLTR